MSLPTVYSADVGQAPRLFGGGLGACNRAAAEAGEAMAASFLPLSAPATPDTNLVYYEYGWLGAKSGAGMVTAFSIKAYHRAKSRSAVVITRVWALPADLIGILYKDHVIGDVVVHSGDEMETIRLALVHAETLQNALCGVLGSIYPARAPFGRYVPHGIRIRSGGGSR